MIIDDKPVYVINEPKGRTFIVSGFNQFGEKVSEEILVPDSGEVVITENIFSHSACHAHGGDVPYPCPTCHKLPES